jgi:hypothetical protein
VSQGKKYRKRACYFVHKILQSFLNHCPYLGGVQWMNPMEVGIRAVNIIFTLMFVKCRGGLLLRKLIASLEQHEKFIENYLETSVTPNNHYLADITALLYLKVFLGKTGRDELVKYVAFVWREFCKQLHSDGTFYEGSTAYHQLNLEMLIHVCYVDVFLNTGQVDLKFVENKVTALFFACSGPKGYLTIGDDDSGKFIFGIRPIVEQQNFCVQLSKSLLNYNFPKFGLLVAKSTVGDNIISLRTQPAFSENVQPSGHFHYDEFGVTLRLNGEDIFVDPGSGAYTSNVALRNSLRSSASHTKFWVGKNDFIKELFVTRLQTSTSRSKFFVRQKESQEEVCLFLKTSSEALTLKQHKKLILSMTRKIRVIFSAKNMFCREVLIIDEIVPMGGHGLSKLYSEDINWAWIMAPQIRVNGGCVQTSFLLETQMFEYLFQTDIELKKSVGVVAENYGNIKQTTTLAGVHKLCGESVRVKTLLRCSTYF